MKVLLSAYACEAGRGSEPGVGWNTAWELAKHHQVWVLTRPDDGRPAIEAFLAENPNSNLHFVYFTLPLIGGFWKLGSIAFVLHYYLWQVQAYFVARDLHRDIGFDVAHHVTFVRYSTPSFIAFLPIPFVWGPVGGAEMAPKPFWRDFGFKARVYEILRLFAHKVGELDPFARLTAQHSAVVRVTTEDSAQQVRKMGAKRVEILHESSLTPSEIEHLAQMPILTEGPMRLISMGRLLHWKGFHLGIQAFAQANLPDAEYWILGEGPEQANLQALAQRLGVGDRIHLLGRLPRHDALARLSEAHILVHPSLHDSGGWVILEAMASGRPAVCLDLGGPGTQVTADVGIKVPAQSPEQAVQDLAAALDQLAHDPDLRLQMGHAGRKKVQDTFNWKVRGQQLAEFYPTLVNPSIPSSFAVSADTLP